MPNIISQKQSSGRGKKIAVILICAVIIVGVVVFFFFGTQIGKDAFSTVKNSIEIALGVNKTEEESIEGPTNELYAEAVALINDDKSQQAIDLYEEEISNTTDKDDKASLYIELSIAFNDNVDSEEDANYALTYAKKAEETSASYQTAIQLRDVYTSQENTTEPDKYSALADERFGETDQQTKEGAPDGYDN